MAGLATVLKAWIARIRPVMAAVSSHGLQPARGRCPWRRTDPGRGRCADRSPCSPGGVGEAHVASIGSLGEVECRRGR